MKKNIRYVLELLGLFIIISILGEICAFILKQLSDYAMQFIIGLYYIALCGVILYFGNRKLCLLLENKTAIITAFIAAVIFDAIYFTLYNGGALLVIVNMWALFNPIYKRRKVLSTPLYSTWNLFPDGTAVCNNCKHSINFREHPQFICPNCKADMRKPQN